MKRARSRRARFSSAYNSSVVGARYMAFFMQWKIRPRRSIDKRSIFTFCIRKTHPERANFRVIYRLPPLNALRVFEAAARHLSFKEAANELSITQAAVSHQIKSLEEYLGVEQFRRAGRRVQLTEAARACLPRLREGFESLAAAVEMIRERAAEADLLITAPPVFTARWLMPRLAAFAKLEPKIGRRVFASSKMVDAGALDSPSLVSGLDLREDASGVEIHLGSGHYPGYRADRLFGVAMTAVANPELVKGDAP